MRRLQSLKGKSLTTLSTTLGRDLRSSLTALKTSTTFSLSTLLTAASEARKVGDAPTPSLEYG